MRLLKRKSGVKTAGLFFDVHRPHHDKRAYKLALNVLEDVGIDEMILGGDFLDMFSVMSHPKDPGINMELRNEILDGNEGLDELDARFPKAKKVYLEGNHEDRFARFIRDKAPELYGILDCKNLLRIPARKNWTWVDYDPDQQYRVLGSKLIVRHEPIGGGEHVAANTVKKACNSVMFGHVHRIQEFQIVTLGDDNHRGICAGWLGNKKHPAFKYVKNHHQWALAFAIVRVLEDGTFFSHVVHIIDYKCSFGGKIYEG